MEDELGEELIADAVYIAMVNGEISQKNISLVIMKKTSSEPFH